MTLISVIVGSTHGNAGTHDGHVARSKVTVGDDRDAVRHGDARVAGGVAAHNDYPDRREDAPRAVARLLGAALEATTVMVPGAARMIPITHPEAVVHALRREVVSQTEAKENDHQRSPGAHDRASAIPFAVPDERAKRSHNDRKGKGGTARGATRAGRMTAR